MQRVSSEAALEFPMDLGLEYPLWLGFDTATARLIPVTNSLSALHINGPPSWPTQLAIVSVLQRFLVGFSR